MKLMQRSTHSARRPARARCRSASSASASAGHVEVAVRQHDAVVGDHQRAVGGAVELDLDVFARARAAPPCAAPCTCATQRNDSGSWTRRAAPACHSALPSSSARKLRGGLGLARRGPRAPAPAGRAATGWRESLRSDSAIATSSARRACAQHRASTSAARPTVAAFALISARPSLAASATGARPARASASRARQTRSPSTSASPSPISGSASATAAADPRRRSSPSAGTHRMNARVRASRRARRARAAKRPSRRAPCPRRARTSSRARRRVGNGAARRRRRGRAPRAAGSRRARPAASGCAGVGAERGVERRRSARRRSASAIDDRARAPRRAR